MNSCKLMDTPVARGETLSLEMCPKTKKEKKNMSRVSYSSAIGSLMYIMCTCPDISYAVSLVSRYQSNPGRDHWKAVEKIFRYLKGTVDYSLCYSGSDLFLRGYADVVWAGDRNDRKSTSDYAFLLNSGAISWKSKKQTCTTLSIMESEFVACASAVQEAVWLKRLFEHLNIAKNSKGPLILNCDGHVAISYTNDPKYHSKTKRIDIKYNFVRDIVVSGEINLQYIPTREMIADPFTKAISRDLFEKHVEALGLRRI
ncbi:secreted RxLR effector protein 161-like [Solanum dulcamara]|uniref:secreted RxLR effector protein 161-like n=1 Tax=Solanum dulcamara TaxID=45834 RepID=UPI0024861872|nr:secreted RxLR effector protein 161-like [Solanum dulcamara]